VLGRFVVMGMFVVPPATPYDEDSFAFWVVQPQ
jgi:hypothetical protein